MATQKESPAGAGQGLTGSFNTGKVTENQRNMQVITNVFAGNNPADLDRSFASQQVSTPEPLPNSISTYIPGLAFAEAIRGTTSSESQQRQWDAMDDVTDSCKGTVIKPRRCGMFDVMRANEWLEFASALPQPKMLFDCLWFEGEICFMFSESNTGKSALAVQVANSIASGIPISGFRIEAQPQPVIYVDFELSPVQFRTRYHDDAFGDFQFHPNVFRSQVSRDADTDGDFEGEVLDSIKSALVDEQINSKVVIIDNLTYLLKDAQDTKTAASFMKRLKEMVYAYGVSLMVISHTPKRYARQPFDQNSMAGSKMLINFVDSCFAVGYGSTPKSRYIKQIKARSCEIIYHAGNVPVLTLDKRGCALTVTFEGYSTEDEQLFSGDDEARLIAQVKDLKSQGMSVRGIADKLGIDKNKVSRLMKK